MAAYKGRFAPSPTGALHLGAARTALLAWLRARRAGGEFFLRMDDLDTARVRAGAGDALVEDLHWLGLDFDGAPLSQSGRLNLYEHAFDALKGKGLLYACSCSRADLSGALSAPHGEDGAPYPGLCRGAPRNPGRPLAWRFRMDVARPFDDLRAGVQPGLKDDFVVRRGDGTFSYQFACAADDGELGVTEVVRGDDLLGSASRQAALLEAWSKPVPDWLHVPLMRGPDGSRLGKRHGSVAVAEYRKAGWKPEEVVGLLAWTLGLLPAFAVSSAADLVPGFSPAALPPDATVFRGPWPQERGTWTNRSLGGGFF